MEKYLILLVKISGLGGDFSLKISLYNLKNKIVKCKKK